MKKFLFFTFLTVVLLVAAAGIFGHYLLLNDYIVFVESFGGGVLTVDSINTEGEDDKYRVICKYNEALTIHVNPERTGKRYYNLQRLTVNGEDVTDQVSMLQYKTNVTKKMSVTATFVKGTPPAEASATASATNVKAPEFDVTNSTPYLGSLGAYNLSDPAVIYDEKSDYYYAFAADNFVVHSKDLVNWTGKTNYFKTVITDDAELALDFSQFKSVRTWAKTHGYDPDLKYSSPTNNRALQSPAIIRWGDTYYLYFALSKEENRNESAIFCVSTDDLEGAISGKKWKDCGLVLATCDGDADSRANAVHPSVFAGADGGLYMAYGASFDRSAMAGCIYLAELDGSTGLLKETSALNAAGPAVATAHGKAAAHAGTLLADPGSVSAKDKTRGSVLSGAEMFYHADSGYYYLLLTYGVAERNQSVRAARSRVLTGPYLDPAEHEMDKFETTSARNQYTKGLPVLEGYNFDKSNSGGVSYANVGKASPGGPCVFQTKNGAWMLAAHAQIYFKVDGELTTGAKTARAADLTLDTAPSMEIRELRWSDGWPLAAAEAYAGEMPARTIQLKHMIGNWDVITFPRSEKVDVDSVTCRHSQIVTILDSIALSETNIARGTKVSRLHFADNGNGTFTMLLDGDVYTIAPALCWDWELSAGTLTFTGMAENGNVVWGKKNISSKMGLYTDAFYALLAQAEEETQATYTASLKKIESDPSQNQIDRLTLRLARELLAK